MVFTTRKFDGKKFEYHTMTRNEDQANKFKKSIKEDGCLCRVIKSHDYSGLWYDIWKRCEN